MADVDAAVKEFSKTRLNGDGVVPPGDAEDEVTRQDLADVVLATGGGLDRSGQPGVDRVILERFLAEGKVWVDWEGKGGGWSGDGGWGGDAGGWGDQSLHGGIAGWQRVLSRGAVVLIGYDPACMAGRDEEGRA